MQRAAGRSLWQGPVLGFLVPQNARLSSIHTGTNDVWSWCAGWLELVLEVVGCFDGMSQPRGKHRWKLFGWSNQHIDQDIEASPHESSSTVHSLQRLVCRRKAFFHIKSGEHQPNQPWCGGLGLRAPWKVKKGGQKVLSSCAASFGTFARVVLQNPAFFPRLFAPHPQFPQTGLLASFVAAWLDRFDGIHGRSARKLSALGLCVLLRVSDSGILRHLQAIVANLTAVWFEVSLL